MDCQCVFGQLAYLLNVLGTFCMIIHMLRIAQAEYDSSIKTRGNRNVQGLIQEMGLSRPCYPQWGSDQRNVMHVMSRYLLIKKVLSRVGKETKGAEALIAQTMLEVFESFEFVSFLHSRNEIFDFANGFSMLCKGGVKTVNANFEFKFSHRGLF